MRTAVDQAGRIVVPKKLRDRVGLVAGTEVEIYEDGSGLRVRMADTAPRAKIVETDGGPVIVGDGWWSLTDDSVREMVEDLREERLGRFS